MFLKSRIVRSSSADGLLDLPGSWMAADQPQCRFESEPRTEQAVHHDVVHVPAMRW